jgi:hypothetical protein
MKKASSKNQIKKRKFYAQIAFLILICSGLSGMLVGTDVYSEVHNGIVEVLCLSCLKLDPKTTNEFIFETVDNAAHPSYVTDNLSSGIVFLHYSEDACPGCDIMLPVVQNLFSLEFEKTDMVSTSLTYKNQHISYFYTNIDHAAEDRSESFKIYDDQNVRGMPMFTIVTLGYYSGIIKPTYVTVYGTFGVDTDQKRTQIFNDIISDAFTLWNENIPGYEP